MPKILNFGLVGYKFMGKAHSNALQRIGMFFSPDVDIRLKAICGRDEVSLKAAAEKFAWEGYETSWEKLIKREDIDVIDITAPSNVHKEIAIAAAQAGKHVFCEKPLAMSCKDAREILDAVRRNKVKHQIGFNYRFAPAVQLAKKFVDEGRLGKIYHFRALYLQDWLVDPQSPLAWRLDKNVAGSGAHGDLGAHFIDLARFLVGDINKVVGINKTFITKRPYAEKMYGLGGKVQEDSAMGDVTVDNTTLFMAEFKNGALGSFEATRFALGHKNALSFEINGSRGSLKFDLERINELQYFNLEDTVGTQGFRLIQTTEEVHPYASNWWPAGHVIGYEHTFVHELYEFVQAITNDKNPQPDFYDGMKCSQVLDAVDESIKECKWIDVVQC